MQLPVAGLRAIVYDFAKVTFGAAMNYCASNEAELFFPTSFELLEWLRDHAKEPIWYGNQSGSWCVIILPSTGESEKYECEMDAAGFICARQTSLSSANVEELVLQFAANITATMNEWSPDIWKRINDALQQRD